jgi:hypothetical protein
MADGESRKSPGIFREAAAAVSRARMQKLRADAAVATDRVRDVAGIRADFVAEIRDFVHIRDFHREKGIRGILYHFGGAYARKHEGRLVEIERPVNRFHRLDGAG